VALELRKLRKSGNKSGPYTGKGTWHSSAEGQVGENGNELLQKEQQRGHSARY